MIDISHLRGTSLEYTVNVLIEHINALEEKYKKLEVTLSHPSLKDAYEKYKTLEALVEHSER